MAPLTLLRKLDLYRVTLGHLTASQMYHRGRRLVRTRMMAVRPPAIPLPGPILGSANRPFALEAVEVPEEAIAVAERRFRFIQLPEVHMPTLDWTTAPEGMVLWSYYLHYFGYAVSLAQAYAATADARWARAAAELMTDWVAHNPMPRGHGWHPYPVSRRLSAWAVAIAALQDVPEFQEALPTLLASVEQQSRHLVATREYDVLGNHLFANLQALTWVKAILGPMLSPALNQTLAPFAEELWAQFLKQTKPDGSHEENSLSYQMIVAQDAFETMVLLERQGQEVLPQAKDRLQAMFSHLMSMVRPDGALPMVNDTMQGYPMPASDWLAIGAAYFGRSDLKHVAGPDADLGHLRWLLGTDGVEAYHGLTAAPPSETAFGHTESGYYVMRSGWAPDSDYTLFDCGPVGPRHLMAHAHADTLAVEIHALGCAIVTDPGVYEYRVGPWRDHFRSTAAHSTVTIDGQSQSEVWSSFRVARRAEAWCDHWQPGSVVSGAHDGYRRLPGRVDHRREVTVLGPHRWRITDRLRSASGTHDYLWTFQLAPGAIARVLAPDTVEVRHAPSVVSRFTFAGTVGTLTIEDAWVSERWNEKQQAPALRLKLTSPARDLTLTTEIAVERVT